MVANSSLATVSAVSLMFSLLTCLLFMPADVLGLRIVGHRIWACLRTTVAELHPEDIAHAEMDIAMITGTTTITDGHAAQGVTTMMTVLGIVHRLVRWRTIHLPVSVDMKMRTVGTTLPRSSIQTEGHMIVLLPESFHLVIYHPLAMVDFLPARAHTHAIMTEVDTGKCGQALTL
jgi:hypothetical protein